MFSFLNKKKKKADAPLQAPNQPEKQQLKKEDGPLLGFVLLDNDQYDYDRFFQTLKKEWGLEITDQPDEKGNLVSELDGMMFACSFMPGPVPDHEVEDNASFNFLWKEAVETVSRQKTHLLVTVVRYEDLIQAHLLFTKLVSAWLAQENVLAIYFHPTVQKPAYFRDVAAATLKEDTLPTELWVHVDAIHDDRGYSFVTMGLNRFGKLEFEIIDFKKDVWETYFFLCEIIRYTVTSDVTFQDGETIGVDENDKNPLTISKGVYVEGDSIKISV